MARATLENRQFLIRNGQDTYRLEIPAACATRVRARFLQDSNAGQALGIWQIGHTALQKLEETVGLDFWTYQLEFVWPAAADYYGWGTVNITRGDHWDVVGHELGHGVYDLANIGAFGGGQHRIDECYTGALALSEGWASYFAAWLRVALDDPDARFEYMVPRRAPIRFEHVPEDVCKGPNNEWRATAFLWDVIDTSSDGENSSEGFARVWKALENSGSGSLQSVFSRLTSSGFDSELLGILWDLNFRTPRSR